MNGGRERNRVREGGKVTLGQKKQGRNGGSGSGDSPSRQTDRQPVRQIEELRCIKNQTQKDPDTGGSRKERGRGEGRESDPPREYGSTEILKVTHTENQRGRWRGG